MKPMYILLIPLMILLLACGLSAPITVAATSTPIATQKPANAPNLPTVTLATPVFLQVRGCWNVRAEAGVDAEIVRVQCDGEVEFIGWSENGFIKISDGYICNQAVGGDDPCR